MSLRLTNTLTRRKEAFEPIDPEHVSLYVCGPTVYNHPHIGNARPAVVFDVLARVLRRSFPRVTYARNITDIDDKINAAAKEQGVPIEVITDKFTQVYHDDLAALGVLPPDVEPRATAHIPEMITMMERLIDRGNAYAAEGHVLFHVPSFSDYGALSGRNRDEMIAGARVEVAPYKRDPADFVLWKPSPPDLPGWDSPWGRGRPGWHIECSAMIEQRLGATIDIHGGGQDLVFPHHENEIAQGTCAHDGQLYCRYWVHNGFVNVNAEKMSKSLGNVLLVKDLLAEMPGEVIRLALLSAHYRQPLDWTDEVTQQAKNLLDRLYGALRGAREVTADADVPMPAAFLEALEDDLNTPKALAELSQLARALTTAETDAARTRAKAELLAAGGLIGLLKSDPEAWFKGDADEQHAARIDQLIVERRDARKAKDFARADEIRDQLTAEGIVLEDGPQGTIWRRAS